MGDGGDRTAPTYVVVVLLLSAVSAFLFMTVQRSEALFTRGIAIAEGGAKAGANTALMTNRVQLLALTHEIVTFKATALMIGATIAILGGLFVLTKVRAGYDLSVNQADWSGALRTTSPGLVMVTLGCGLVSIAILSKVTVPDPLGNAESTSEDTDYGKLSDEYKRLAEEGLSADTSKTVAPCAAEKLEDHK